MTVAIKMTQAEIAEARDLMAKGETPEAISEWLGCTVQEARDLGSSAAISQGLVASGDRTSRGLRDILFNEIELLQAGHSNPQRAGAVANLAKQIVNVAKVESEFICQRKTLGSTVGDQLIQLGSPAVGAGEEAPAQ